MDRISNLPSGIIENILCFLPIQEAARTSILSREWRCQWIKIPKLTISEDTFHVSTDAAELSNVGRTFETLGERIRMFKRRKILNAINQVLSKHEGPIHEFTLSMEMDAYYDEIERILSHLAQRNTVKKLKLHFHWKWYGLPQSLFSFRQLTDLCLAGCYVNPPSTFNGFNILTSLSLQDIHVYDEPLRRLLSNCPLLKNVTLGFDSYYVRKRGNEYPNIINLFECLPVVETLSISRGIIQSFNSSVHDGVPRELPTALIHLKYLTLNGVRFTHLEGLSFLVLLIKSSPNLEKLEIDNRKLGVNYVSMQGAGPDLSMCGMSNRPGRPFFRGLRFLKLLWPSNSTRRPWQGDICSLTLEDYADIWLEHLNELHIRSFKNQGNELNFVKLILAKSPVLKKVTIYPQLTLNEWMQISKVLPRVSPVVVINV